MLTFTEVFLNQKRINVCEQSLKMVPCDSFEYEPLGKEQDKRRSGGDGGKIECKFSEVSTSAISVLQ